MARLGHRCAREPCPAIAFRRLAAGEWADGRDGGYLDRMKISCLGPEGTCSEQAALGHAERAVWRTSARAPIFRVPGSYPTGKV